MNTFPTYSQGVKSSLKPEGKLLTKRSTNGTFHGQYLLAKSPYRVKVFYLNLTLAEKENIIQFFLVNKVSSFNFNFQLLNRDMICNFYNSPKVKMSETYPKWDVTCEFLGYIIVFYVYVDENYNYYVDENLNYYVIYNT